MNKNDRHIKGFTLLEVLVGTLILSILLTTLYSFWNAFMKSGSQVIEEVTDNEGMQNAFNRMSTDLEQLFIVQPPRFKKKGSEFDPDDPYRFLGKETNKSAGTFPYLSFASLAHLKTGIDSRPGVARIVYYVKSDKNNLLNLYRADNLEPFPEEETACEDPVLFKNISA
ncbi:MAG: prepilin-type N-terminal cleavage/methylation domain-containing protein, partial [Desulfobacteraceae bacterium]|nr:prepilin-type N-terminal cleavage/methylation domain-containing protein [Desulfobacteraceae bacterium]